ncbi:MAG: hypothetical protein ACERKD_17365 [Prolixibacteraceae bacterium]
MNFKRISIYPILIVFTLFYMISCDEDPNDIEYGFPLIYMPQSTMLSGGLNNNYPVPGPNTISPNYSIDSDNKINVVLGVYRSGLQSLEAYSVDVYSNADTLNYLIDTTLYTNRAILPADVYSIPESIAVVNGERETTFYLVIDKAKLVSNYQSLKGQTLVTAIGIKNPSKYELNKALCTTVVLIDSTISF